MEKFSRNLILQLGAVPVLLLLCILIRPVGLAANNGFSYYGDYETTVVPYAAALILYAFCLWKASEKIGFDSTTHKVLAFALRAMALLLIGLVITPSNLVSGLHTECGTLLFSIQLLISIWMAGWLERDWITIGLTLLELAGGLMAFYYLPKPYGLLLQGQAIFQLAFELLLIKFLCRPYAPHDS